MTPTTTTTETKATPVMAVVVPMTRAEKLASLETTKTKVIATVDYDAEMVSIGIPLSQIVDAITSSASGKTKGFTVALSGTVEYEGFKLVLENKGAWVTVTASAL